MSDIHHHGDLEDLARREASRYSWTCRAEHRDRDLSAPIGKQASPGQGSIVLTPIIGGSVVIPYHLPEDSEAIVTAIRKLIQADQIDRDRRAKG
jgi:hypothetical protein